MEEKQMTFWAHLEDLRWSLIRVVAVLLVFVIVCFCAMPYLFDHFVLALTHISTSFWFALVLMFPYLIFEIWRFVQPALFREERRSVGLAFIGGTFMFFLGCAVGYMLVFPFTFRFLTEYQLSTSIVNQISLTSYMGNFLMLIFVMGIVFELPLLAWLLSKMGLVTKSFFRQYRKHAVVILLVLSALITPSGDPFTLMVVFLPIYLLYELGIKFSRD